MNMFNGFKHKKMPYSNYKNDIKVGVDIMNSYILELLANNNNEVYDYLIKWYPSVAQGKKNETCLYLKGPEGIGKSTISDFMRMHVLGKECTIKFGNALTLMEKFNSSLMGKIIVCYEELPTFSKKQWEAVSGILKDRITSREENYESKGKDPICAKNYIKSTQM